MPKPKRAATSRASASPSKSSDALALPKPRLTPGTSLVDALRRRATTREIGERPLSRQLLSDLLWAACGVNRPQGPFGVPGITAASASNSQEIELYVVLAEGVFRFEAREHRLAPVVTGDLRALTLGRGQPVAMKAPVQLVFVVDVHRLTHTEGFQEPGLQDPEVQKAYYYVDTGLIAGNVYLFAAARGLACWFHNCDRAVLAERLPLRPEQRVLFAQSVGYRARA